jgi:hypothetical protein
LDPPALLAQKAHAVKLVLSDLLVLLEHRVLMASMVLMVKTAQ